LGYTEYLGCVSLFEAARRDELLKLDHQIRSDQQMLGLFTPKPEVAEYIPSGRRDFQFHDAPPSRTLTVLNQPKLKTLEPPGIRRECLKVMPRRPKPQNRLFCHDVNMQVLVYFCQGTTFS
jgi:hypothetical protein